MKTACSSILGVAVVAASNTDECAAALAAQLELPLVSSPQTLPDDCALYLSYRDDRLQLFPSDPKQSGPVCVDFANHAAAYRLQSGGELVVKAVQGRSKGVLNVIDATAGLGRDSFVLAAHACDVVMFERNAVVAALLADGLARARLSSNADVVSRMRLLAGDARVFFSDASREPVPDVIYLDPMFAHNEKTALVKKEMRLFRQLLEDEQSDETQLFSAARACARLRMVVKRALKAPYLADVEPAYSLAGKAIRFDVYPS